MQEDRRLSLAERLGTWGAIRVVWCAIPWYFRPWVFPYCLLVYRRFLAECADVDDVKSMHIQYCYESKVFRWFRPRFHLIKGALLTLDAKPEGQAAQSLVTMVLPIVEDKDGPPSTDLPLTVADFPSPAKLN